jgi:hypothetical protein
MRRRVLSQVVIDLYLAAVLRKRVSRGMTSQSSVARLRVDFDRRAASTCRSAVHSDPLGLVAFRSPESRTVGARSENRSELPPTLDRLT